MRTKEKDTMYLYKCGHSKIISGKRMKNYKSYGFPENCKDCAVKRVRKGLSNLFK